MSVNTMSFEDASTLLNTIKGMATGESSIAPVNESEFVSVATTLLQQGYDPIATGISQLVGRTIFSDRRYAPRLRGLMRNSQEWGGITRKVNYLDLDVEQSQIHNLVDGTSIDPFAIRKQQVIQTNIYGGNTYAYSYTITEDQLKQSFTGSAQFASYMAGMMTNVSNTIDQFDETESRAVLMNLIAANIDSEDGNVFHLLTDYKTATGNNTITDENYLSDEEFVPFAKWLYGYINTLIDLLGERSVKYHINVTTYNGVNVSGIKRFTPRSRMKCYMHNALMNQINSSVLSSVFHNDLLRTVDYENISYWQSIDSPTAIQTTPVYMDNTGAAVTGEAVSTDKVVGVLFDEEACGLTRILQGTAPSPYNARGRYYTVWMNFIERWYCDFTENSVVLMLD